MTKCLPSGKEFWYLLEFMLPSTFTRVSEPPATVQRHRNNVPMSICWQLPYVSLYAVPFCHQTHSWCGSFWSQVTTTHAFFCVTFPNVFLWCCISYLSLISDSPNCLFGLKCILVSLLPLLTFVLKYKIIYIYSKMTLEHALLWIIFVKRIFFITVWMGEILSINFFLHSCKISYLLIHLSPYSVTSLVTVQMFSYFTLCTKFPMCKYIWMSLSQLGKDYKPMEQCLLISSYSVP